jgi:hypothetical protein
MCGLGPSCVEHWLLLCPSTALALSEIKNEFWEFERLLPCPHDKLLQTLKALTGIRRYLLAFGELGKVSSNSTVNLLRQSLQSLNSEECTARILFHKNQILALLSKQEDPLSRQAFLPCIGTCPRLHANALLAKQPALLRSVPTANRYKKLPVMTTNGKIDIGDEIACFDADSPLVALVSSCVASTRESKNREANEPAQRPNSALRKFVCHCGKEHFTLSAALPCGAHQQVLLSAQDLKQIVNTELTQSVQFDYLLVQTDGSFLTKSDHTAGGAGLGRPPIPF